MNVFSHNSIRTILSVLVLGAVMAAPRLAQAESNDKHHSQHHGQKGPDALQMQFKKSSKVHTFSMPNAKAVKLHTNQKFSMPTTSLKVHSVGMTMAKKTNFKKSNFSKQLSLTLYPYGSFNKLTNSYCVTKNPWCATQCSQPIWQPWCSPCYDSYCWPTYCYRPYTTYCGSSWFWPCLTYTNWGCGRSWPSCSWVGNCVTKSLQF